MYLMFVTSVENKVKSNFKIIILLKYLLHIQAILYLRTYSILSIAIDILTYIVI